MRLCSQLVDRVRTIHRHRPSTARLVALIALLALACGGDPPPPAPIADPATLRTPPAGDLIGYRNEAEQAHVWRGIPFAQPPVGDLRWRAPRKPASWTGTREALAHEPACVQFGGPMSPGTKEGEATGDEDCLYLDVYAPVQSPEETRTRGAVLPVMVWIHGGGNTVGSASPYDGSVLARDQGVVVVTVQYRLGVFGWLSHPALRAGASDADSRSGNFGTLDLVRALEWVQENIAAFGGDPGRVTVFGESAGGTNTYSMLLSPRARGLFSGAIVQSGGPTTVPLAEAENLQDAPEPGSALSSGELLIWLLQQDGRAADRVSAQAALAAMPEAEIAALLRGSSAADLLSFYPGVGMGGMYDVPRLFRDGAVLPTADPLEVLAAGGHNRVPTIMGSNRDETKLFSIVSSEHVTTLFGVPLWLNDERRYDLENEYMTVLWKTRGVDRPAAAMRAAGDDHVFAYRFDWDEEPKVLFADISKMLGAAHAMEIPFVFGRLRLLGAERFIFDEERKPAAAKLSAQMMSYWGQFAHTGDPGGGRDGQLTRWTAWGVGEGAPLFMLLDTDADGGLRMSTETYGEAELIARIDGDARFESAEERCTVYQLLIEHIELEPGRYERFGNGECRAFPLEIGG